MKINFYTKYYFQNRKYIYHLDSLKDDLNQGIKVLNRNDYNG